MGVEQFVRSFDGTNIYVRTSGEGLPVVLCDGIGCDGFIWRHLAPELEKTHRVVRWHYRGHGNSGLPADPEAVTIPDIRRDLLAVLEALEIDRAVLIGHSMGTQVILDFAVSFPERVLGLVPLCGSYGRPIDTVHDNSLLSTVFPHLRDAALRWPDKAQWLWSRLVSSEALYQYASALEVDGRLLSREELQPYFAHVASMDLGVFVRMLDAASRHTNEERLHEITAPTLIIGGDQDKFSPIWLSRRMHRLIPGSELLVVPRGSHVAPLEQPELIELRLRRFLQERIQPAASEPARKGARRRRGSAGQRREAAKA